MPSLTFLARCAVTDLGRIEAVAPVGAGLELQPARQVADLQAREGAQDLDLVAPTEGAAEITGRPGRRPGPASSGRCVHVHTSRTG